MSRLRGLFVVAAIVALAGCSPTLSVHNDTPFEVRVVVTGEGGSRTVHLVRAGQSSAGDIPDGAYSVTVVPDRAWVDAARTTRELLAARLLAPDSLGAGEVAEVLGLLDSLSEDLARLEAAGAAGARCLGSISIDGTGSAEITVGGDGALDVTCSGEPAGTPRP